MKVYKIPKTTIERLPVYFRTLQKLEANEVEVVSSKELGEMTGIPSAQVRKDFSYYGEFGRRGVGYDVISLRHYLQKILGLDRPWPMILVGAGNLGKALINYEGFLRQGLEVKAILDNDPEKVGAYIQNIKVDHVDQLQNLVKELNSKIGIIAVPGANAQLVAEKMIENGIKGIWNFSPQRIKVPEGICLRNEDLAVGLMALIYITNQQVYQTNDEIIESAPKSSPKE